MTGEENTLIAPTCVFFSLVAGQTGRMAVAGTRAGQQGGTQNSRVAAALSGMHRVTAADQTSQSHSDALANLRAPSQPSASRDLIQ